MIKSLALPHYVSVLDKAQQCWLREFEKAKAKLFG
jgi:hypothetical protein